MKKTMLTVTIASILASGMTFAATPDKVNVNATWPDSTDPSGIGSGLAGVYTSDAMDTKLNDKADKSSVTDLEITVGDSTKGLVKAVDELSTGKADVGVSYTKAEADAMAQGKVDALADGQVATNTSSIDILKNNITDSDNGLIKKTEENRIAIETEKAARESADTALSNNINNLATGQVATNQQDIAAINDQIGSTSWGDALEKYSDLETKIENDSSALVASEKNDLDATKNAVGNITASGGNVDLTGFTEQGGNLVYTGKDSDVIAIDETNAAEYFQKISDFDTSGIDSVVESNVREDIESKNSDVYDAYKTANELGFYEDNGSGGQVAKTNDKITSENRVNIDAETTARIDADKALDDRITRNAVEQDVEREKLALRLDEKNTDQDGKISANTDSINTERAERIKEDKLLNSKVDYNNRKIWDNKESIDINRSNIEAVTSYAQQNRSDIKVNSARIDQNSARIDKNATDIKDLRQDFESLSKDYYSFKEKTNGAIAGVAAMGQIPQPYGVGNAMIGAGVGAYDGEQAIAVGLGYRYSESVTMRAAIAANSGNDMEPVIAAGVGYEW